MNRECEVKFLGVNVKSMRALLKGIGAKRVHRRAKYIRLVYFLVNNDPNVRGYCRVRCEVDRIFITVI